MQIINFIDDRELIKTILKHLGLWLFKSKPIHKAHAQPAGHPRGFLSKLSMNDDFLYRDPDNL
jgi:hypothetical protein